ncbi:hypothetical protein [Emticicia fontis]
MEIFLSVLALLVSICALYIQRVHNEKSIKPLGQIDVIDSKTQIGIYIQNNGVGPLIIDKLIFTKNGTQFTAIKDCLTLDPKMYWHVEITNTVKKVVASNLNFIVFEKNIEGLSNYAKEDIRKQLTPILLKVIYRDIYGNKFSHERNLNWFSRHMS